jgi:hypothetical protein
MTTPDRTIITPRLLARWFVELADLIRNPEHWDQRDVSLGRTGRYEHMSPGEAHRLEQIMNDLLVRLDDASGLAPNRTSILARVQRNHRGEVVSTVPRDAVEGAAGVEGGCVCGEPTRLGTVHRPDGPCYIPADPLPAPGPAVDPFIEATDRQAEDWDEAQGNTP